MSVWIKYVIKNLQPFKIADENISQSGQSDTIKYMVGTSMRGIVVHMFSKERQFETKYKEKLLSNKTIFTNAYPIVYGHWLLPTPKGYYEEKRGSSRLQTIWGERNMQEGLKHANLGDFVYLDDHICYGYHVPLGETMNIKISEEKEIFRSQYLTKGQEFGGWILTEEELIDETLSKLDGRTIYIGGRSSSGYGKCIIKAEKTLEPPFLQYCLKDAAEQEVYIMALSDVAMRSEFGEITGLNLQELQEKMGVNNLQTINCATVVRKNSGFNRTWGTRTPEIPMYAPGSIFRFSFDGLIEQETMRKIEEEGIGIRLNEGCGRILFIPSPAVVTEKSEINILQRLEQKALPKQMKEGKALSADDRQVLEIAAKRYYQIRLKRESEAYIVNFPIKGDNIPQSQLGNVQALCSILKYQPECALKKINEYLSSLEGKEKKQRIQKQINHRMQIVSLCRNILDTNLEELFGIPNEVSIMTIPKEKIWTDSDDIMTKIELLEKIIQYKGRGGIKL